MPWIDTSGNIRCYDGSVLIEASDYIIICKEEDMMRGICQLKQKT